LPRDGADAKRRLRSALAERRRRVSPHDAAQAAAVLASAALEEPRVQRAGRVALYAACEGELPTRALFDRLGALRIERLFPRVEPRGLAWARVTEWEALVPGRFGILEPIGAGETLGAADVVFVPGFGFDRNGGRLGRGGGHYDQAVPTSAGCPWLVGVGYSFQWVAEVPCDSRDRRMDAIVTEHGWVWRSPGVR
jgi:5-formyltetrahydrofolate cyclo-ligase